MDTILDDPADVRGVIYCVEHIATAKKYVGQTRSHRLNHGRYRPFGADGRFRSHISEAICNTKHKTGHLLGIEIRQFGPEAFRVNTMETCDIADLDDREIWWIGELNTVYPHGFNLSSGAHNHSPHPVMANPTQLAVPKQRGGSKPRSQETREKMSQRAKEALATVEAREQRAQQTTAQHAAAKAARFAGVTIETANPDQYIFTKGVVAHIRVGDHEASFAGKGNTKEQNIQRAKEFLLSLQQPATLPNCSGNP